MSTEVFMPKFGMTMEEGELVSWLKKEGDNVKRGDPIVEIMSNKITNQLEAQVDGTLEEIIVKEGETAVVGAIIGKINEK